MGCASVNEALDSIHNASMSESVSLKEAGLDQGPEIPHTRKPLRYHLKTLLLFTLSDFKTVMLPQSTFAVMCVLSPTQLTTAGWHNSEPRTIQDILQRLPHMLAWLWLHLLVENIANQRTLDSMAEDQVNKPWRPLPARRLTPDEARGWLLGATVAAVSFSLLSGNETASLSLVTLIWMYNDLGGSGCDSIIRNALNAGGLMCFSWGALSILSSGKLLLAAHVWIWTTGSIIVMTVHAQDLPDQDGDKVRGRLTAPLVYGERVARWSFAVMVVFWSAAAPLLWNASPCRLMTLLAIGGTMAGLSLLRWGRWWDEVVWRMWCVWMMVIYALPTSRACS